VGKAISGLKDEAAMAEATARLVGAIEGVHTMGKGLTRA
jgi:hypothetical protein